MTTGEHALPPIARRATRRLSVAAATMSLALAAGTGTVAQEEPVSIVATTEVLGSIVEQLAGDAAEIHVIMPSGADPHSYEASARDAERILKADVLVSNGLDLEEALLSVLASAESEGVTWFEAADYIAVRDFGAADAAGHEEDHDEDDDHEEADHDDHGHGSQDPHIWTDPLTMRDVVVALESTLADAGAEVADRASALVADLEALDAEVESILATVPAEARKLVTGHRSLGYFADRYGFEPIGTVIPGLSTSGEPSARELAQLIEDIEANSVSVVFAEVGTPQSVAEAVASDSGAELVELSVSELPEGGSYQDLIREIAATVAGALAE